MEASDILEFQVDRPFHFNWAGKFEAPDEHWMHMSRTLIDFELIVMTKGTLYIAADKEEMVLQAGEYAIICPPCHQYGYRPSDCTFYWAHFVYHDGMDDQNTPLHLLPSQVNAPVNAEDKKILLPMRGSLPRLDRITVLMKQIQDCDRKYRNVSLNDFNISAILCEIYSQLYLSGARTTMKGKKVQLYTDIIDYISWRIHEKIKVSFDSVVDDILNIHEHNIQHYCVLGVNNKRVEEYENELAKIHWETKKIAELKKELETKQDEFVVLEKNYDNVYDEAYSLKNAIKKFNSIPWWKRMFKKIEVK